MLSLNINEVFQQIGESVDEQGEFFQELNTQYSSMFDEEEYQNKILDKIRKMKSRKSIINASNKQDKSIQTTDDSVNDEFDEIQTYTSQKQNEVDYKSQQHYQLSYCYLQETQINYINNSQDIRNMQERELNLKNNIIEEMEESDKLEQRNAQLLMECNELLTQKDQLQQQIQDLQYQLQQSPKQQQQFTDQFTQIAHNLEFYNLKNIEILLTGQIREDDKDLLQLIDMKNEQISNLQQQIEQLTDQQHEIESPIKQQKIMITDNSLVDDLNKQLIQSSDIQNQLTQQMFNSSTELELLNQQKQLLQKENQELIDERSELVSEVIRLKDHIEKIEEDKRQELEIIISDFSDKLSKKDMIIDELMQQQSSPTRSIQFYPANSQQDIIGSDTSKSSQRSKQEKDALMRNLKRMTTITAGIMSSKYDYNSLKYLGNQK